MKIKVQQTPVHQFHGHCFTVTVVMSQFQVLIQQIVADVLISYQVSNSFQYVLLPTESASVPFVCFSVRQISAADKINHLVEQFDASHNTHRTLNLFHTSCCALYLPDI